MAIILLRITCGNGQAKKNRRKQKKNQNGQAVPTEVKGGKKKMERPRNRKNAKLGAE